MIDYILLLLLFSMFSSILLLRKSAGDNSHVKSPGHFEI